MVSYYQIEGINTFFVIQVDMTAANSYETDMLYNNFVDGIIQPEFRALNGEMLLYSKINGMRSLRDIMNVGVLSLEKTLGLMSSLYNVIIETGEYMLYPDNLVIAPDKIFYSPLTDDFHYIYVPGTGIDIRVQMKKLVEDVIRQTDHSNSVLVDFMYELYGMVTSPNCDISAMHEYVNEQKLELTDEKRSENDYCNKHEDIEKRDSMLDIVFGDDSVEGACAAVAPVENSGWQRRVILSIGITAIGGICMLMSQIVIGGGITDVRFFMVILAMLSLELLVYIELRKKEVQSPPEAAKENNVDVRRDIIKNINRKNCVYSENTEVIKSSVCPQVKLISSAGEFAMNITPEGKIIGRDERVSDVVINDTGISRQHVYMYPDGKKIYVEDMGSTNGTVINGIRLPKGEAWLLADGDIICIGEQEYRIQILLI